MNEISQESFVVFLFISTIVIAICIYINILKQKQNKKLYKVAYIDDITQLGNASYFKEKGIEYLQKPIQNEYIIALDVNKFNAINKIYGYDFCNSLLKELGNRLVKSLPENNITCRMSNDIFASIFNYEDDIKVLLDKIVKSLSNLQINNINIRINLSIGVYKINSEDKDFNECLNKAYMSRSKIKGLYNKNYYIFDKELENELIEEEQIESCMESALKNGEFKVIYQPKIFAENEGIAGAEALVRWYKNGEILLPAKFIPLFEKNKFIIKLDLYVFEQVCKDISEWKEKYNYYPIVSINVSQDHFVNENFIDEYLQITNKYNIDRKTLDLEITESATVAPNIDIVKITNKIKKEGFIISLDDFGTGYSSLGMLQNIPIDVIKVDKIFVDKADLSSNRNIINHIILIAKSLNVQTVIEGVETKQQVEFIKKIKGDIIQGYYYSKPMLKEEFEKYFNEHR